VPSGPAPDPPLRSLAQAEAWLEGLINVERRPEVPYARLGLDPIRRLLARVGDPQAALSVVHVAGSKGKGSTALLVEALLRGLGERVATFTSPHLERWTERFRVDGREVEGERLLAAVERLRPHVDALRAEAPASAPTFFDVTTAAAMLLFAEARVDRAVLEVGLGGRLDSTNVVDPAVTCITTIELEHTDKLGTTPAALGAEQAGIV
jgi:dihydrofolate synthase/folylpolyglutamate synthase